MDQSRNPCFALMVQWARHVWHGLRNPGARRTAEEKRRLEKSLQAQGYSKSAALREVSKRFPRRDK